MSDLGNTEMRGTSSTLGPSKSRIGSDDTESVISGLTNPTDFQLIESAG